MNERRPDDELFAEAQELPPEQREGFLRRECEGDEARVAEILSLLGAADRAAGFLDTAPQVEFADTWVGSRVGPFEIETLLASGGSGRVYRARRVTGDFEQRVAVKILARSLDDEEDSRRFRVECEALARLEHPHIARMIDAGLLDGAHPYLVMELVEGAPLHEFCDARQLGIDARLRLFRDVCEAVEYAHHNLVIHRDLKPGNVLVSEEGRVKLLDFGIAKLLAEEDEGAPDSTLTHQVRLTPRYASPEQLAGRPVSTLSDVYSLGVVLYELVTGKRPYDLSGRSSREWEEVVATTTVTLPSEALDDGASTKRGEALAALKRRVRGDLDNVLLKAMHRDPPQRYSSPMALAEDLDRHLRGLPVEARPDSVGYRVAKFVRRNAALVGVSAILMLALLGATLFSTAAYLRMRAAQQESEAERARAERTLEFLQSMLASADPEARQSSEPVTVQELLEVSSTRIDEEMAGEPLVAARLFETLGDTYVNLGDVEAARRDLARAYEFYASQRGERSIEANRARAKLATALVAAGELDEAYETIEAGLSLVEGRPDSLKLPLLIPAVDLWAQKGEFERAAQQGDEAIAIARRLEKEEELLQSLVAVGIARTRLGNPTGAVEHLREAASVARALYGDEHSRTGQVLQTLGYTLKNCGREAEAIEPLEQALGIVSAVYDSLHTRVAVVRTNLGDVLGATGRFEEAEPNLRAAVRAFQAQLGPDHPNTGHATNSLGSMFLLKGDYPAAIPRFLEAARIYGLHFGEKHPYVASTLHNMSRAQLRAGDVEAARRTGERVWKMRQESLPADHPDIARSSQFLGRVELQVGRPDAARPWLERASELRRKLYAADNVMRIDSDRDLGRCLQALGEFETADTYLRGAYEALVASRGEEDEKTLACAEELAALDRERARLER